MLEGIFSGYYEGVDEMKDDLVYDIEEAKLQYAKLKRKHLILTKSTMSCRVRLPAVGWHVLFYVSRNPSVRTVGISNICSDGFFVSFFDYDNILHSRMQSELLRLQRRFDLGTLVVLTSRTQFSDAGMEYGNYHAIGCGKIKTMLEHKQMLMESSVDEQFIRVPDYYNSRCWVLRIYEKLGDKDKQLRGRPVLREILQASTDREISTAHMLFLERHYGIPVNLFYGKQDGNTEIKLINYGTTDGRWRSDILPKTVGVIKGGIQKLNERFQGSV